MQMALVEKVDTMLKKMGGLNREIRIIRNNF